MRRMLAMALITSGLVVGSTGPWHADVASAQALCGSVLLRSNQWLQGAGVEVHSNGPNQFSGVSCNGVSVSTPSGQYGYGWQCVELAARLYRLMNWGRVYANGGAAAGQYRYGAQYIPEGSPSLRFYPVSSAYVPVPGDLVIEAGATFGHVSVVDHIEKSPDGTTQIIAAEQNASLTGWHVYQRGAGTMTGGYHPIKGFLHSPLNTHVDKGSPRRGFVTALVTSNGNQLRESSFGVVPVTDTTAKGTSLVSAPTVRGSYATAYIDPRQHVWYIDGQGRSSDTGVIATSGVSPSLALDNNDSPTIAVQGADRTLVIWRMSGAVRTGYATRTLSTPSVALDNGGRYFVAYITPENTVSVATSTSTTATGLSVASGTNPSFVVFRDGSTLAYVANSSGLLQSASGSSSGEYVVNAPLSVTLKNHTSPVIARFGDRDFEVAYINAQGQLRLFGSLGGLANSVKSDSLQSSPSLSIRNDGMMVVAAVASDGRLWRFNKSSAVRSSLNVAPGTTPSILLLH